jgi:hypothetical protein
VTVLTLALVRFFHLYYHNSHCGTRSLQTVFSTAELCDIQPLLQIQFLAIMGSSRDLA